MPFLPVSHSAGGKKTGTTFSLPLVRSGGRNGRKHNSSHISNTLVAVENLKQSKNKTTKNLKNLSRLVPWAVFVVVFAAARMTHIKRTLAFLLQCLIFLRRHAVNAASNRTRQEGPWHASSTPVGSLFVFGREAVKNRTISKNATF